MHSFFSIKITRFRDHLLTINIHSDIANTITLTGENIRLVRKYAIMALLTQQDISNLFTLGNYAVRDVSDLTNYVDCLRRVIWGVGGLNHYKYTPIHALFEVASSR